MKCNLHNRTGDGIIFQRQDKLVDMNLRSCVCGDGIDVIDFNIAG